MADQIVTTVDCSKTVKLGIVGSRALSALVVAVAIFVLVFAITGTVTDGPDRSFEWLPPIESTINDAVIRCDRRVLPDRTAEWAQPSAPCRPKRSGSLLCREFVTCGATFTDEI